MPPQHATAEIRQSILDTSVQYGYLPPNTPAGTDIKVDVGASLTSFKSPYRNTKAQKLGDTGSNMQDNMQA